MDCKARQPWTEVQAPSEKEVKRKQLRRARKAVASRYYQLMSGHAAIGPYLKDKIRLTEDTRCWWSEGGKKPTSNTFSRSASGFVAAG